MISNKHISKLATVLISVCLVLCVVLLAFPNRFILPLVDTAYSMEYESKLFDTDNIIDINIIMDDATWSEMLENAISENYYECDVVVNGTTFHSVGIRPKGNTSLSSIAHDPDNNRYSFKLEFDHYIDGQTCFGLDKLALNNNYADVTNMKEAIVYDMYKFMGADASLYNYAKISVNDSYWGVYLAIEAVEDSFMHRNFGMQNGNLYKPDSMDMGDKMNENGGKMTPPRDMGAMPNRQGQMPPDMPMPNDSESGANANSASTPNDFQMPPQPTDGSSDIRQRPDQKQQRTSEQGKHMPSPFEMGERGGNNWSNLNYIDDDLDSYCAIWDGEVNKTTDADNKRVVTALKNISLGSNLEKYLDIDNVLKYMAVHSFVVNDDSLSGNMAHNYYLYESKGKLNILPWDYNLSFGGMRSTDASYVINDPIDTPFSATKFFDALLKDEQYLKRYHDYYNKLVNDYVFSGEFHKTYKRIKEQISDLVKTDPNAMYTFDEFVAASDMLYNTVMLRAQSIKGQLDGTIPSTSENQRTNPDALLDASSIDISIMGQFHGGGGPKDDREFKRPFANPN